MRQLSRVRFPANYKPFTTSVYYPGFFETVFPVQVSTLTNGSFVPLLSSFVSKLCKVNNGISLSRFSQSLLEPSNLYDGGRNIRFRQYRYTLQVTGQLSTVVCFSHSIQPSQVRIIDHFLSNPSSLAKCKNEAMEINDPRKMIRTLRKANLIDYS